MDSIQIYQLSSYPEGRDSTNAHTLYPHEGLDSTNSHTLEIFENIEESNRQSKDNYQVLKCPKLQQAEEDNKSQENYHSKEQEISSTIEEKDKEQLLNPNILQDEQTNYSNDSSINTKDDNNMNLQESNSSVNQDSSSEYQFLDIYNDNNSINNNIRLISNIEFFNFDHIEFNLADKYQEIMQNIQGLKVNSSNIIKLLKQKKIILPQSPYETSFVELVTGLKECNDNSTLILRFLKMSDLEKISQELIEQVINVVLRQESYEEIPSLKEFIEYGKDLIKNNFIN